jgi:hypothetical protein
MAPVNDQDVMSKQTVNDREVIVGLENASSTGGSSKFYKVLFNVIERDEEKKQTLPDIFLSSSIIVSDSIIRDVTRFYYKRNDNTWVVCESDVDMLRCVGLDPTTEVLMQPTDAHAMVAQKMYICQQLLLGK